MPEQVKNHDRYDAINEIFSLNCNETWADTRNLGESAVLFYDYTLRCLLSMDDLL